MTFKYDTCGRKTYKQSWKATSAFDANGNTTSKTDSTGTTTYAWDFENRLTSITLPGSGRTVYFKYDPFGRRIYKSSPSSASIYAYDGDNIAEETNSTGTAVARYAQGLNIDEPLAMLRSGATSYYQADGLGSLTSLSTTSGAMANTYTYDSFGNLTASTGSVTNSFRYTGREWDSETNLYYYRARYYDPQGGRFINEDPTGFRAGTNFYTYVGANPLIFNDPTGLDNREERCKAIKKALENIDKDIKDALDDLARDAKQLPETCPGDDKSPRLSIRGHRNIINKLNDDKLFKLVEYIARGCSDFDPPPLPPVPVLPPVPMRSPNSSPAGQTSTATGFVVGILIFLGILAGAGNF